MSKEVGITSNKTATHAGNNTLQEIARSSPAQTRKRAVPYLQYLVEWIREDLLRKAQGNHIAIRRAAFVRQCHISFMHVCVNILSTLAV